MARKLAAGHREDRALAYLMGACVLIFVAQWPLMARQAHLDATIPLDARVGYGLLGWVIIMPLVMYGIAAALHIITRVFKGQGTWFTSRLALFWSLLALTPAMLLQGLTAGFVGPGAALNFVGVIVVAGFFWLLVNALIVAERGEA